MSFVPQSPVSDTAGASRTFSITIDQPTDVRWRLNGIVVKDTEKGVTEATYTRSSAPAGTWKVSAFVSNDNGGDSREWDWTVTAPTPTPTPIPTPTPPPPGEPVNTATGTGTAYFDSGSGSIEDLKAVSEGSLHKEGKPDLQFTHGFFSFNITGLTPGETVTVTIALPGSMPEGTQYWKYDPIQDNITDHWYQIPIGSDDGDNIITITITDGGTGDHDLTANGEVVDPGGPRTSTPLPVPEFSPTGLLALISVLSVVLAVVAVTSRRRRE